VVYDRTIDDRTLELGAVGLDKGLFLLYDRQTGSRWNQIVGRATRGPLKGSRLRKRPSTLTTWGRWRALHPGTTVFSDPELIRKRRFTEESVSRVTLSGGGPVVSEDLVVGVEGSSSARADLLRSLASGSVANDTLDGEPIAVFLVEDGVTPRVFRRSTGTRTLTLELARGFLHDEETGSQWDPMSGSALGGPLEGKHLEPVVFTQALWYAWRSVRPDTTVWGEATAEAE
jgi:hypothetical protein